MCPWSQLYSARPAIAGLAESLGSTAPGDDAAYLATHSARTIQSQRSAATGVPCSTNQEQMLVAVPHGLPDSASIQHGKGADLS